jgi:hypothetical protein
MLTTQLIFDRLPAIGHSMLATVLFAILFNGGSWSRILVLLPERVADDRHSVGILYV